MGIIFDVIILAILGVCIFFGYKNGLVNVIFKVCAFLVAAVVTLILYRPITNLVINNTDIDDKIANTIIENATKEVNNDSNDEETILSQYFSKYIENTEAEIQNSLVETVAEPIANNVVSIGVAIVLFIVIRIALILLNFVTDKLAELPIIKQCNELGGIAYGALKGILIIYAILAVIFFIISINNNETLNEVINTSFITKFMYAHNILLKIII